MMSYRAIVVFDSNVFTSAEEVRAALAGHMLEDYAEVIELSHTPKRGES